MFVFGDRILHIKTKVQDQIQEQIKMFLSLTNEQ
jgi:hypothetical protein